VIKTSLSKRVDELLSDLGSDRTVVREAAIARLIVAGARAVEPLTAVASNIKAHPATRSAALRALEGIGGLRALDGALRSLDDADADVASAAISVVQGFLLGSHGALVVGRLTAIALDRQRDDPVRVAAIRALQRLQRSTLLPLIEALKSDPSEAVRALVAERERAGPRQGASERLVRLAVSGALPDEPAALRHAVALSAHDMSLSDLMRLIDVVRERERASQPDERLEWMAVRATAHRALAHRGSRIALYDLKETLEATTLPLAAEFVEALMTVGDASCLEAIASAYAKMAPPADGADWWRRHLVDAFRTIAAREGLTRRHGVVKKIEKRWPAAHRELWGGPA
jgi:HEAT repeat protein